MRQERAYLLGEELSEPERLALESRVWEPETERMLDRIGPPPGARCVDVGCGARGILAALSRRAGPHGRVLGLDSDARLLGAARSHVEREGLENVELREGDPYQTFLPRASFDLAHARFLLASLGRDRELLRELIALVRPGGFVAMQEPDAGSWSVHPEAAAFADLRGAILAAFRQGGGDFHAGRRIYGLLHGSGLQNVQIRPALLAVQSGHPYMRLPLIIADSLRPRIIDGGILSEAALDGAMAGYEAFLRQPGCCMVSFTLMQVWGRIAAR